VPDLSQLTDAAQNRALTCPPELRPKKDRTLQWIIIGLVALVVVCCCCLVSLVMLTQFGNAGNASADRRPAVARPRLSENSC